MKTAFTFKVKEELNSFDDIKLIEEEKVEELEENRETNDDLVDNQETDKNSITSKGGDSLEKDPRILECLKQIKQKEKLLRVCIL